VSTLDWLKTNVDEPQPKHERLWELTGRDLVLNIDVVVFFTLLYPALTTLPFLLLGVPAPTEADLPEWKKGLVPLGVGTLR